MAEIKVGDKVRIKDRKDWPTPPGFRLAKSEGTVVKWVEWEEVMKDFQDYLYVHLEKSEAKEYIGNNMFLPMESLEKI